MARTESNMLPLGTEAPGFELPDTTTGTMVSIQSLSADVATVIMFICNHCPYVKHVQTELSRLAQDYQVMGCQFAAINSNDVDNYPEDSPDKMKAFAKQNDFIFPYLYDETQTVAKAYQAACTPDFYIFDSDMKCVYRGQLDGSRPENSIPVTGKDIRNALDKLLASEQVHPNQTPSLGCNIKWKY